MDLKNLIKEATEKLEVNNIDDSRIIAKLLIEKVFGIEKEKIILNYEKELNKYDIDVYNRYINEIILGRPIQYIMNSQEFMNLNFYVDENVLIPQPDTEIIVEEIISKYKNKECKILDLCTGSGAIAVSLAKYIEKSEVYASDISNKALQIAKLNAERNLVHRKMHFFESDMFDKININDFDVIVSNPPYIKTKIIEELDNQVKNEPFIALDGGRDGLKFYRIIINNAPDYLKNDGELFLEIGYDQKEEVISIIDKNKKYYETYSKKDFGGNDRLIATKVRR